MFLCCSTKKSHTQIDKCGLWKKISLRSFSCERRRYGCLPAHRGFPRGASLVARAYNHLKAAREIHMPLGAPKDHARFWVRPLLLLALGFCRITGARLGLTALLFWRA